MKRVVTGMVVALLGLGLFAAANQAQAQTDDGRIFIGGVIHKDANGDGKCSGEMALAGVPLELSQVNADEIFYQQSNADGQYGADGLAWGSWLVTVKPPTGYIVTSDNPLNVYIHNTETGIYNVNFCVSSPGAVTVVLPESGGSSAMPSVLTALAGLGVMLALVGGLKLNKREIS
jgi:hypothetical protein